MDKVMCEWCQRNVDENQMVKIVLYARRTTLTPGAQYDRRDEVAICRTCADVPLASMGLNPGEVSK